MAPPVTVEITARTLAFSPSGDQIFFLAADDAGAFTGGIVDPASQAIVSKSGLTGAQPIANWSDGGLQVLWIDGSNDFQIEDVASEQFAPFLQRSQSFDGYLGSASRVSFGAWSRDGAKIAVWDQWCSNASAINGSGLICFAGEVDLYVVVIATGASTKLVNQDATDAAGEGPVAFSPDGKKVAYVAGGGGIYVLDVP